MKRRRLWTPAGAGGARMAEAAAHASAATHIRKARQPAPARPTAGCGRGNHPRPQRPPPPIIWCGRPCGQRLLNNPRWRLLDAAAAMIGSTATCYAMRVSERLDDAADAPGT